MITPRWFKPPEPIPLACLADLPIGDAGRALVAAVVQGVADRGDGLPAARWAFSSVERLTRQGHLPETIEATVGARLLVRWTVPADDRPEGKRSWGDPPNGELVTLTPWAAEALGLEIVEDADYERPRWALRGTAQGRLKLAKWARFGGASLEFAEAVVDPAPSAESIVMMEAVDADTGQAVIDLETGERQLVPLIFFGVTVPIDNRIKGRKKPKSGPRQWVRRPQEMTA